VDLYKITYIRARKIYVHSTMVVDKLTWGLLYPWEHMHFDPIRQHQMFQIFKFI